MKQLVKHLVRVRFYRPIGGGDWRTAHELVTRTVDCANAVASRALGREIAEWMAQGVGYRVESETLEIERK